MTNYQCPKCGWPEQALPNSTVWHHCPGTPGHDVTRLTPVTARELVANPGNDAKRVLQLLGI